MTVANKQYPKKVAPVQCRACGTEWLKRVDSLGNWRGHCQSCASKELAKRPDIQVLRREVGRRVMKAVGKLPHYPHNYRSGPANNKWRGGITPENQRIRRSPEMLRWRKAVLSRDNFTCQVCETRGGDLHADHIQPFALFPELRFELGNGRTLCVPCHYEHGARVCNGVITRAASFGPAPEKWTPVPGKPHLEKNEKGALRTNLPLPPSHPSVPYQAPWPFPVSPPSKP